MRLPDPDAPVARTALRQLLPSVPEALFLSLLSAASLRAFRRGDRVLVSGHPSLHVALVESGHVALQVEVQQAPRLAGLRGPGSLLGAGAWLRAQPHDYSVVAVAPCRVFLMSALALADLLQAAPEGALDLARHLAGENAELLRRLRCLHLPLRARLAQALMELASEQPPGTQLEVQDGAALQLPVSRTDLASLLGAAPESVSRAVRSLTDDGLIRLSGRRGVILDAAGLASVAAGAPAEREGGDPGAR